MDSVDKLREYAAYNCRVKGWKDDLKSLADDIEAEVESEYMKLPVDADGVPIRVGDKIEHRGHTGDVWLFGANEIMCTDRVCYPIGECHLVKPRTLEDVLTDLAYVDPLHRYLDEHFDIIIAKYAAEIRELLGGDADEQERRMGADRGDHSAVRQRWGEAMGAAPDGAQGRDAVDARHCTDGGEVRPRCSGAEIRGERTMSYSKCFVCREDNFSGNETRITVERKTVDKDTLEHRTTVWSAHVCDPCMKHYFPMLDRGVSE